MNRAAGNIFQLISWIAVFLGVLSCLIVAFDLPRRRPQMMFVMNLVWPINALWAGPVGIWMYWKLGRMAPRSADRSASSNQMDMPERSFWQKVVAGTLHCGSGCTLADLVGPFVFAAAPFAVLGSMVYGEWTLDFILALLVGVSFQYMALSPMLGQKGLPVWWRAFKVDFFSLSAWQVGMYGWMALVIFVWFGRLRPEHIEFWFMMQLAMACGFLTAYPMNWFLIRVGVKTAM
jgi:hypothetical protein